MPLNLIKTYNAHLDIGGMAVQVRTASLRGVFDRDITNHPNFKFRGKNITPTPKDGAIVMSTLFSHLTTVIVDKKTQQRDFEIHRSKRLHWVKHHIEEKKKNDMLVFTVKEPRGKRTYVYDITEKYVIVLEPKHNDTIYYLLTAYNLRGKDEKRNSIMKKYRRRSDEVI